MELYINDKIPTITYEEFDKQISKIGNTLKVNGFKKGDVSEEDAAIEYPKDASKDVTVPTEK